MVSRTDRPPPAASSTPLALTPEQEVAVRAIVRERLGEILETEIISRAAAAVGVLLEKRFAAFIRKLDERDGDSWKSNGFDPDNDE